MAGPLIVRIGSLRLRDSLPPAFAGEAVDAARRDDRRSDNGREIGQVAEHEETDHGRPDQGRVAEGLQDRGGRQLQGLDQEEMAARAEAGDQGEQRPAAGIGRGPVERADQR